MSQQTRKRFEDNPELRKEVAAKTKEQFMDPEQRRQASERATKQFSSTAAREEMGKRTSALWANPDFREKLVKANQKRWRQPGSKDKYIDETLFVWKHSEHGTVRATRYDLKEKYQLTSSALSDLVFSSQPSYKGWSVVSAIIDGIEVDVRIWAETKGAERANVARRDPKVYTWSHQDHGVIQCTQYDFRRRFELNKKSVSKLVNGKLKTLKGWSLIERPEEG